jgi:hypothetical protein
MDRADMLRSECFDEAITVDVKPFAILQDAAPRQTPTQLLGAYGINPASSSSIADLCGLEFRGVA